MKMKNYSYESIIKTTSEILQHNNISQTYLLNTLIRSSLFTKLLSEHNESYFLNELE